MLFFLFRRVNRKYFSGFILKISSFFRKYYSELKLLSFLPLTLVDIRVRGRNNVNHFLVGAISPV